MLTAVALVSVIAWVMLAAAVVARLVDALDRRRVSRVVAQVQVTDAIHGALGAIVAPIVVKSAGKPWTVRMGLGPRERSDAGRLAELAWQALDGDGATVRVVFVPRPR